MSSFLNKINKFLSSPNFLFIITISCFIVILIKVIFISFQDTNKIFLKKIVKRGNILDIHGKLLVYSEKKYNFYLNKNKMTNTNKIKKYLKKIETIIEKKNLLEKISSSKKDTFLIAKGISEQKKKKLLALSLPFLLPEDSYQRKYFLNDLLPYTIGFTGKDHFGLSGLEYQYQNFLSFSKNSKEWSKEFLLEKNLYLNIDLNIQYEAQQLLKETIKKNKADSGIILIQRIKDKTITAIVNSPTFDLKKYKQFPNREKNNAVFMNVNPGSIFKTFFLAYLLESGKINFKKQFYCDGYSYFSKKQKPIKCNAAHGHIMTDEILKYSCNSAMIEICKKLTSKEMYYFLKTLKIGEKTGIDFPYEAKGELRHYTKWRLRTKSLIPIGYGLTLPPLQIINIFTALIGNGYWEKPKIANRLEKKKKKDNTKKIHKINSSFQQKIISTSNINILKKWLKKSTEKGSTGYLAAKQLPLSVLGKTSTAQIINRGVFSTNKYNSGFIGAFPLKNPKYSILVLINNPKPYHSGAKVAAPLFNKIVRFISEEKKMVQKEKKIVVEKNISFSKKKTKPVTINTFPNVKGLSFRKALTTLEEFKKEMENNGLSFRYHIKNEKSKKRTVISQFPSYRQKISLKKINEMIIVFD